MQQSLQCAKLSIHQLGLQDLMRNACDVTNVVEACNTDGRQERLENMLVQLEQCQKALQVRYTTAVLALITGPWFTFFAGMITPKASTCITPQH